MKIHSVTDISHTFSFYFDGRFAMNYIHPLGGADARNWATLHKCKIYRISKGIFNNNQILFEMWSNIPP